MRDAEISRALEQIRKDYEEVMREQRERIVQLREENSALRAKLEESRKREAEAGEVLAHATAKAREIENAAKLRYRTEIQRLREFHVRWEKYYEDIGARAPEGDRREMKERLERINGIFEGETLLGETGMKRAHESELRRVGGRPAADGGEGDSGFRLDEVLYPKDLPDLGTLCRELGLEGKDAAQTMDK